ncbi:MAG: hypothetical protein O9333_05965 [Beijerinckiaceae bacterium]|jgi:hypothetical protein|nr:hypothetical protein [Beijerinckiaceae bacterium]
MEQRVRECAFLSVMRGCGFGMIAIVITMLALANQPDMSLKFGGFSLLLMSFILILKAARAHVVPLRSTEVWIMLRTDDRLPEALASGMIPEARREAFLVYAYRSAVMAGLLLALDMVVVAFR